MKAYETLLEVDATGSEFNLACILIGLERPPNQQAFQRVQPRAARRSADRDLISPGRRAGSGASSSAAEALLNPRPASRRTSIEWVYLGSSATQTGARFAADVAGTLIGFVHDPNSVIESVVGVGIGAYGSVQGNTRLPPVGSAIELIVEVPPVKK